MRQDTLGESNAIGVVKDDWDLNVRERRGKHSQDMYLRYRVSRIWGLDMEDEG